MKYIIIGLGNYGHVLAEELSALGHEVIGADISTSRVESLKDKVAASFVIDATDEQALSVLPLKNVDVVIVAIGENFGASIRVTALLKQKQVKHIYARAIDPVHRSVLEAFGLERILTPEADAARGLVHLLEFGGNMETFQVDAEYYVVKFTIPQKFVGYFVNELKLEEEFRLKIVALKREQTVKNCLGISCREHKVVSELPENCKMQEGDLDWSSTVQWLPRTMAPPMPTAVPIDERASLRWCHALATTAGEPTLRPTRTVNL